MDSQTSPDRSHRASTLHVIIQANKQRDLIWKCSLTFFAFQPHFTHWAENCLIHLSAEHVCAILHCRVLSHPAQREIKWEAWLLNSIPLILGLVARLAIARLLLKVAAIVTANSYTSRGN